MVIARQTINNKATKFDDITVIRQSIVLRKPNIINTDDKQVVRGNKTNGQGRKITDKMITIKTIMPLPKTARSLRIKSIISAVIIDTPPRKISALSR